MTRKRPHKGNRKRGNAHGTRKKPRTLHVGTVHMVRQGMATVTTPEGTYMVAHGGLHEAMNGDEVQVSLERRGGNEPKAVVRSVLQRATTSFVGTYAPAGPLGAITPLDGRIAHDFFVPPEDDSVQRLGVREHDVVQASILQYPSRNAAGMATIERVLGSMSDLDLLVESVIASHGLATEFGQATLEQAEGLSLDVEGALAGDPMRRDLRGLLTLTIDPTDARDYDDAVSARRLDDGGYEVGVHIADVTSYLPWDTPMDLEARQRTCSVYLVDRVLPMLPERLSNDLCSLRPQEDRLTMSVLLTLDEGGKVLESEAFPSVIRSKARLDYATADLLLTGEVEPQELPCAPDDAEAVAQAICLLDQVAELRREVRARRGAVDFDTRESRVVLDEAGHPVDVQVRERTRATSLIEEAMLLANEAVAKMLADVQAPSAYRVHERPAPEHLSATLPVLRELQLLQPGEKDRLMAGDPYVMQDLLARAKGTPAEYLVSTLLLRAQKRAVYLSHNAGHYALGAPAYCHFTSPIRRYPDVVAHRALKALLTGMLGVGEQRAVAAVLPQLCRTCSDQERVADNASRDSQKAKMAELYAGRVGERYTGIVIGCERYGLFVMLEDTCAEGLLPTRALGEGWFTYDDKRQRLTGEGGDLSFSLGQRIVVEVAGANPARGQIDFVLPGGSASTS